MRVSLVKVVLAAAISVIATDAAARARKPLDELGLREDASPEGPGGRRDRVRIGRLGPQPIERGLIAAVALSTDGRAALSRDDEGNVMFWPSLDGKVEPVLVDVQSAEGMALAPSASGFTLAIVDTAGGGHVFRAGADGKSRETATIAPTDPISSLQPIPGEGRVLALGQDSTVRLYGETGKPLARIEQRDFRPTSLCVAVDGKTAMVVIEDESVQAVSIGKKKLALTGEPARLPAEAGATRLAGACSPAANRYAFLRTLPINTGEVELVVADLAGHEVATQKIGAQFGVGNIGFSDESSVFLWAAQSSLSSWKYDLKKKELVARSGRPDITIQGANEVVAGGRRIGSDGAWLFVQDIDGREQRFLGYEDFMPFMAAMSPGGVAAFVDGFGNLMVEDVPGDARKFLRTRSIPQNGLAGIYFVDDDHLLVAEASGSMRLIAWRTGKEIERVWSGFFGGDAQYEATTHMFRVNTGNGDTRLWDVDAKGFTGPYIIADGGFSSGLLAAAKPSDLALWTLDGNNVRREYTLAEIRKDLSLTEMQSRGKQPVADEDGAFLIDARGRKYVVQSDEFGTRVEILYDGKKQVLKTGFSDVSQIFPSPDGSMIAVSDSSGTMAAFKLGERHPLWTYSDVNGAMSPTWAADGSWLALIGTGAVVLDGKTGDVVYRRRVLGFEKRQVLDFPQFGGIGFGRRFDDPGIIDI
jgi:hypothetical protein